MHPQDVSPPDPDRAGDAAPATPPTLRADGWSRGSSDGLGGLAFAGLGFQFAVALVGSYYLGQWLDRRFGTAPVFLLACMLLGAGGSFYVMYTQLMRAQRRADDARRRDGR
ncbi:AtpZ/AtpI family protein [Roseisolibacter sp. H3M3-2]|uniref:AtpZ/AtpI family protein n=1 Tax=Roseisolibacter sp. H3M3-2 TaxID=3031323 RepID=UPI0023D9B308|nr:AtpZ/AtpI family protein [Roseisolibacter sp. H3M3-2]MDF1501431.1 AtpZ/AtpI family protein [Roseisolibacter sp. H3M3-2]